MTLRAFVPETDGTSRAINLLSRSVASEFTSLVDRVNGIDSRKSSFFASAYTASTAGVAFTTGTDWSTMLSVTASIGAGVGTSFKVTAVANIACPNATATVALRLLGGSSVLFEEHLISGTVYGNHTLIGVHELASGETPIFALQVKRTAGDGNVSRTALGICTERGYS